MISRRELILSVPCVAAAGAAYQLHPRKRLNLLGDRKMAAIVPVSFGNWSSQTADELVRPETEGKLASRLYSETVSRVYADSVTGDEVMMLIAYGNTQSDLLQLHRPESCYPAVGFRLASTEAANLTVGPATAIPGRRVVAEKSDRREFIVYWTRLGEYLPADEDDQRKVRLLTAMKGYVSDGALFRFSTLGDPDKAFPILDRFVAEMIGAVKADERLALIGPDLARQLAKA